MSVSWVTGAAGFIGSTLAARLVHEGDAVFGLDCLTDFYDERIKNDNIRELVRAGLVADRRDLSTGDFSDLPKPDRIFHLAGQPGVRPSWGSGFDNYLRHNIQATQRLTEYATENNVPLVYASSSSVYGILEEDESADEKRALHPHSPYGVTKLAAENIVRLYSRNFGLPSASMRYFTVYGPKQRPDMAIHRIITSALSGNMFELYGDGSQIREFTYVTDVVDATIRASHVSSSAAPVFNVAGGSLVRMSELIETVGTVVGRAVPVRKVETARGDVPATRADTDLIVRELGWKPTVGIREGLANQATHLTNQSAVSRGSGSQ